MSLSAEERRRLDPASARALFRDGLRTQTSGWCSGWTQANLIAVPQDLAHDLLLFAQRNPKPCPVLDVGEAGEVATSIFDGDLRTDLPAYRVYEHGELVAEVEDVREHWRPDLVAFLIGCSFTFETALLEAGVPVRHVETGTNVPMYRTSVDTRPAGSLHGPLVVSMRPVPADQVATAVRVTSRYPAVHGAPVHVGDPRAIGDHRPRRSGLRRSGGGAAGRGAGVLGLRGDAAGRSDGLAPVVRHRARAGPHGDHGRPGLAIRRPVTRAPSAYRHNRAVTPGEWSAADESVAVWPGRNWPLGATWGAESTNFAVHAPNATAVWVCLFDDEQRETRHALTERSLGIWHGALPGVRPGQQYGFRADGPWDPARGMRFNPDKLLLDPYARAVSGEFVTDPAIFGFEAGARPAGDEAPHTRDERDSAPYVGRSVVVHDDFDWGDDRKIGARWRDTAIYELHVKGFTALHDRIPRGAAGDVRRARAPRGHRLPQRPRHHRGRAAADPAVRLRAARSRSTG